MRTRHALFFKSLNKQNASNFAVYIIKYTFDKFDQIDFTVY